MGRMCRWAGEVELNRHWGGIERLGTRTMAMDSALFCPPLSVLLAKKGGDIFRVGIFS